jgi:hypothetical protein
MANKKFCEVSDVIKIIDKKTFRRRAFPGYIVYYMVLRKHYKSSTIVYHFELLNKSQLKKYTNNSSLWIWVSYKDFNRATLDSLERDGVIKKCDNDITAKFLLNGII